MNDEIIRIFAALPVTGRIRAQARDLPRKGLDGARWTSPDDLHITLRFMGDVPAGLLPDIKNSLARVKRPCFNVEVKGLGSFVNRRQTIFWANVYSTRKMTALTGDINEALLPLGFDMPNKPFTPHITFARLKKGAGLDAYISRNEDKIGDSWRAVSFGLYLSGHPNEKGNRYSVLAEYPLQAGK